MVGGSIVTTPCTAHTAASWAEWEIANATTETTVPEGPGVGEAGGDVATPTEAPTQAPTAAPTEAPAA